MLGPPKARDLDRPALVSLEALVPANHFYRHLDATLDLGFVRAWVQDRYAARGRPSIDPVVFFRLQLVMFFEGLRSERQLLRVAADRLSLRWYLGYALDEPLPDHSSLTRIRARYGLDVFRRFFDAVVEQCRAAGLVWGAELYLDATQVEANAALDSVAPRFAVEAHLVELFPGDVADDAAAPPPAPAVVDDAIDVGTDPAPLPVALAPEARAALAAANAARHDWVATAGRQQREVTHNDYRRRADFQVSRTDPDATVMRRKGGGAHLGYHTHYVVDGGKARVILRALVTPAEVMENQPALDLVWQTCFRWHLRPHQVTGDTTYGTIDTIKALEQAGIRAFMPIADADKKNPLYGKGRFAYDDARDVYVCPQGQALPRHHTSHTERLDRYQAPAAVCNACPCQPACTTSPTGRTISRSFDEAYVERVRAYAGTAPYEKARRKRQVWVEPLFGEAKAWHGLRRFRLRGLDQVNSEALITATGQNLKRLLSRSGWGRRPWPSGAPGLRIGPLAATWAA